MGKNFTQKTYKFFDKLEDRIREQLSKNPILYTFIGGTALVLFWRGIWHTGDIIEAQGGVWGIIFSGPGSIIISVIILLMTGLFVSFFVGDVIILSGVKKEKKLVEKTVEEMAQETQILDVLEHDFLRIERKIEAIEAMLEKRKVR